MGSICLSKVRLLYVVIASLALTLKPASADLLKVGDDVEREVSKLTVRSVFGLLLHSNDLVADPDTESLIWNETNPMLDYPHLGVSSGILNEVSAAGLGYLAYESLKSARGPEESYPNLVISSIGLGISATGMAIQGSLTIEKNLSHLDALHKRLRYPALSLENKDALENMASLLHLSSESKIILENTWQTQPNLALIEVLEIAQDDGGRLIVAPSQVEALRNLLEKIESQRSQIEEKTWLEFSVQERVTLLEQLAQQITLSSEISDLSEKHRAAIDLEIEKAQLALKRIQLLAAADRR